MKKASCALVIIAILLNLCSCKKKEVQPQIEIKEKAEVYQNTVFNNLKTFTEITGIESEAIEYNDKQGKTVYTYSFGDIDINKFISDYEIYLNEYGFNKEEKNNSKVSEYVLETSEYILKLSINDDSKLDILLPYDSKLKEERFEPLYKEIIDACNNNKFDQAIELCEEYSYLKGYKEYLSYKLYAQGMQAYNKGDYYSAVPGLLGSSVCQEWSEVSTKHLEEISKYDGVYYKQHYYGDTIIGTYYWFISMGASTHEFDSAITPIYVSYDFYEYGDEVYYSYEMSVEKNEDNTEIINMISTEKKIFKFEFDKDSNLIVTNISGNDLYNSCEGTYIKKTSAPPYTRADELAKYS